MLDDARAHPVVEVHDPVLELVLEVDVLGVRGEPIDDGGQGEVMGGDQADGPAVEETADHRLGPDAAVVRVRAVEQFIEEEEERNGTPRQVDELSHPGDLGEESGAARLERILDPERGADGQGCDPEPPGTHRCPGQCQHGVDSRRSATACSCPTCSTR